MSRVQVSVDYISIVDGRRQGAVGNRKDRGSSRHLAQHPGVAIDNPSGLFNFRSSKGTLVVFAEPDMPGGIDAGWLVAQSISRAFSDDASSSVVSSLNRALRVAHQELARQNLKSLSSDRRGVALACVVVRDQDLYLAQVGPTLALRFRDSELSIIGEIPPAEPITFACTVGRDCEIDIHLCRERIAPGDVVVLSSTALLKIAEGPEIASCLTSRNCKAITNSLYRLYEASLAPEDFSAVVIVLDGPGSNARRKRSQVAEQEASFKSTRSDRRQERRIDFKRIFLFGVLPILLLAGAVTFASLAMQEFKTRGQQGQAISILQKAEQAEREASATQDIVLRRRLLSEAENYAGQALAAKPDDRYIFSMRERIRNELDGLTNVVRISSARRLFDLGQEAKESDPVELIAQEQDLYVFDKGTDRVYKLLFDFTSEQIKKSEVIVRGLDKFGGAVVGHIRGMTWVPAGGVRLEPGLVILDDNGRLYEFNAARGLNTLKTAGAINADAIRSLGGYAGSLYALAPQDKQLVWFSPTSRGYERGPFNYVNPEVQVDLTQAIDFAVDFSVYVLYSNGKIDRFFAGRPQKFDGGIADTPLKAPTAIFAPQLTNSVYVVDAGNQRIVQFSRDGYFERQFRYGGSDNVFSNLRGISVDEQRGKLFFLNDKRLFVADIPK